VISLKLPLLRERKEDIALLVNYYLSKYMQELGKKDQAISPEAMSLLVSYNWPGNVRELQNVIERAILISENASILPEHLPENIQRTESFFEKTLRKGLSIDEYAQSFILKYQHLHGEQELAEKLGITRKTLWEKRKKWGMRRPSLPAVTNIKE
jgi:DNA-binding NtrC family response regulator